MEWIADPSPGAWLRERLDADTATMHSVVPRGFDAYVRVFHPAWSGSDETVPWAEVAPAFGTVFHPLAQWNRLVRTPAGEGWQHRVAPDGREFDAPREGWMPPELLAAIAQHLVVHTQTPDAGYAAVWEGHGGLLGFHGEHPSRSFFTFSEDAHHQQMLQRSIHDPFENAFRKPRWQEGLLSREISEGPRLQLLGRDHVLFSAAPSAFVDSNWVLGAPWRDLPEKHGFSPSAEHPSILWPEDHAWVLVSEIDFDSTVIAGPSALAQAICADDRIEALPIPAGADLSWDADEVNR